MKAKDAIEILKQHPESPIEIYVAGHAVVVENIEVHAWSAGPNFPEPREFFVIPIEVGQKTTGSFIGDDGFSMRRHVITEDDDNVTAIKGVEYEIKR